MVPDAILEPSLKPPLCGMAGGDSGRPGNRTAGGNPALGAAAGMPPTSRCRFRDASASAESPGRCTGIWHGCAMSPIDQAAGADRDAPLVGIEHPDAAARQPRETF